MSRVSDLVDEIIQSGSYTRANDATLWLLIEADGITDEEEKKEVLRLAEALKNGQVFVAF